MYFVKLVLYILLLHHEKAYCVRQEFRLATGAKLTKLAFLGAKYRAFRSWRISERSIKMRYIGKFRILI